MRTASVRSLAIVCIALLALPLAASTRTWTGTSSGSWSDSANWGGSAVSPGDDLVFPAGALNQTNTNDIAAGTAFKSIAITGGAWTFNGNRITLGAGGLSVSTSGNTINLPIALGASQTWTAGGAADLTMAGVISGSGAIAKTGAGSITFSGNNTYSGITTINEGNLIVSNASSLGVEDGTSANGTAVNSGGSLSLLNVVLGNEAISVTGQGPSGNGALQNASCGNATFTGPVTIIDSAKFSTCGPGGSLSFNGPIGGTVIVLHLSGTSPFFLNAVNTFSGRMLIDELTTPNVVNIGVDNAFSDVAIDIGANETLKLNDFSDRIAVVSGPGNIDLGSGTLTLLGSPRPEGSNSAVFSGVISGTGNLMVAVEGTFNLWGAKSTGTATLGNSGKGGLGVDGSTWPGSVVLTGGKTTIEGSVVGPITVNSGATVRFFHMNPTSGNLVMSAGSNFTAVLYDEFFHTHQILNGTANLGGATLKLETSIIHPPGTRFTIIDNDGSDAITGTFAGAPEGGTVMSVQPYSVTYTGGDGNDVVLTALAVPTTTKLTSAPNPSRHREPITFAARITQYGGIGEPTGTVTFFDGSAPFYLVSLSHNDVSVNTDSLQPGTHSITARYSGDAIYASSTSAVVVQIVNAPPPPPPPPDPIPSPEPIPTLDPRALLMLAIALAAGGALLLRR